MIKIDGSERILTGKERKIMSLAGVIYIYYKIIQ